MDAIILENVSKKFKEQTVLEPLTISFEKGKIHGIIGNNGSGKTVLFKIICGLLLPSTGKVTVNEKVVGKEVDFAPNTGIMIENPSFLSFESGFRNLKDLASIRKKIDDNRIRETIKRVGLDPQDKKRVGKYSMGMRQRLGIAQAIMEDPSLLVLDEPMNGLDKHGTAEMRKLLLELRDEGKTILIASHIADDINILCDTVCEIECGVLTKVKWQK
ncbi:MAG: ATP-binding cassette domain-containing protein [Lachnospiraceae bacterium]|nr:ATP-binding cassette domain-containing protein [Lachnospiraceae bacterium]